MHKGHYISGAGHLTLIGWMLFGGMFRSDPIPFEVTEVSTISGADFEALMAAQQSPDSTTEVAQPAAPEVVPDAPDVAAAPDEVVEQPAPAQTETPPVDTPPEVTEQAAPPEAEVTDVAPVLEEPVGDQAVLVPELAPVAVPRPVDRVAPQAVAQPDPEVTPDVDEQQAVSPDQAGETVEEPQTARAPEEATTEIVTEATKAPAASNRPPGRRPAAPTPAPAAPEVADNPTPTRTPAPAENTNDADAAAIAAAVAAAQSSADAPSNSAPSGPPLSVGEKENLRVAVSSCWNVDVGGRSDSTVVTVAVSLAPNGKVTGDVRLLSSEGGDEAAVRTAFGAARRAILRCQKDGFPLPAAKYDHWKEVEMTFNPKNMRIK